MVKHTQTIRQQKPNFLSVIHNITSKGSINTKSSLEKYIKRFKHDFILGKTINK